MIKYFVFILILSITATSCGLQSIRYSMNGASIDYSKVKTFSVNYFTNKTPFAPNLGSDFTEALKEHLRSRTNLVEMTDNNGDVRFEGQITGYTQRPMEIGANEVAASNRLTVTIRVKYTNTTDGTYDFDTSFSQYADYGIDENFDSIEEELLKSFTDKIIDDIYNKAFVNW